MKVIWMLIVRVRSMSQETDSDSSNNHPEHHEHHLHSSEQHHGIVDNLLSMLKKEIRNKTDPIKSILDSTLNKEPQQHFTTSESDSVTRRALNFDDAIPLADGMDKQGLKKYESGVSKLIKEQQLKQPQNEGGSHYKRTHSSSSSVSSSSSSQNVVVDAAAAFVSLSSATTPTCSVSSSSSQSSSLSTSPRSNSHLPNHRNHPHRTTHSVTVKENKSFVRIRNESVAYNNQNKEDDEEEENNNSNRDITGSIGNTSKNLVMNNDNIIHHNCIYNNSQRLESIRQLLGKLDKEPIEKIWRTVLEGALFEARSGDIERARKVLQFLIQQVPWYGPVHYEYFRIEERNENHGVALNIMSQGLKEVPRYGPLWFGRLRVTETLDLNEWKHNQQHNQQQHQQHNQQQHHHSEKEEKVDLKDSEEYGNDSNEFIRECSFKSILSIKPPSLLQTREAISEAKVSITKELIWKVYFEAAIIEERAALLTHEKIKSQIKKQKHNIFMKIKFKTKLLKIISEIQNQEPFDIKYHKEEERKEIKNVNRQYYNRLFSKLIENRRNSECGIDGLDLARECLTCAIEACPINLQWKVWLAGGRMELNSPEMMIFEELKTYKQNNVVVVDDDDDDNEKILKFYPQIKEEAIQRARILFRKAYQSVPEKSKAQVMLECARLEEYATPSQPQVAKDILQKACFEARNEWKVFLEAVMLEVRYKNWQLASLSARQALKVHSGTGRLWAILIQLKRRKETWESNLIQESEKFYLQHHLPNLSVMAPCAIPSNQIIKNHRIKNANANANNNDIYDNNINDNEMRMNKNDEWDDDEWDFSWSQHFVLKQSLNEVPKSGEVWCESGRLHLNPLNRYFDLILAQRHLEYAINFTPQYGDSFIEQIRLILIVTKLLPLSSKLIKKKRIMIDKLTDSYFQKEILTLTSSNNTNHNHNEEEDQEDGGVSSPSNESIITNIVKACEEAKILTRDCLMVDYTELIGAINSIPTINDEEEEGELIADQQGSADIDSEKHEADASFFNSMSQLDHDLNDIDDEIKNENDLNVNLSIKTQHVKNSKALLNRLFLTCTNADPNYGLMWYHCRQRSGDSPQLILRRAQKWIWLEMKSVLAPLYLQALTRRMLVEYCLISIARKARKFHSVKQSLSSNSSTFLLSSRLNEVVIKNYKGCLWENCVEACLRSAPCVQPKRELGITPQINDFTTGFVSLNRTAGNMENLSDEMRRKFLFGSDQIIP